MNMAKILLALTINFLVVFNSHAVLNSFQIYGIGTNSSTGCSDLKNNPKPMPVLTSYGYINSTATNTSCTGVGSVSWYPLSATQGGANTTNRAYVRTTPSCTANATLKTSTTCECNSGYVESGTSCVPAETPPTCTAPQVLNQSTNQCETPINQCENTTEQDLVYKATNNAEVKNPTLIPTSEYQDLCHDSCRFQLQGTVERCFALMSDSSPRPGYCQQSYTPTYQICTAGDIYKASLQITPPADVTTCPTNHTLNDFDICTPDELICPADQAPNAQNICENVACQAGYIRETPESPCTSNSCPAGEYRPTETSPCETNPSCPTGQYSLSGKCEYTACPAGTFRLSANSDCAPIPAEQLYSSCSETTLQNTKFSKCALDAGILPPGNNPSSNTCKELTSFSVNGLRCDVRQPLSPTRDALVAACGGNSTTFSCVNVDLWIDGYRSYSNLNGSPSSTNTPALCPANTILQSNGFCRPEECISQPDFSPACSAGGLFNSSGEETDEETTGDLTETNDLLTNIKNLLDGTDTDGSISDGLGDTLTQLQQDAFTTNLAALETWFDESPIVEAFESILPESPWQAIEDGTNGDCMYESQVLGHTFNLSLCENQQVIHPLIAFMMFIAVSWGIMILIFEKDNG